MSTLPHFYVREHEGYRVMVIGGNKNRLMATEVMVIDRDYCHRVILSLRGQGYGGPQMLERRRAQAAAVCAELNLEAAREPVFC